MEDFFNILMTLGFVAVALLASGRKKRTRTQQTADAPDGQPEGWPFPREFFPHAEPASAPHPEKKPRPAAKKTAARNAGRTPDRSAAPAPERQPLRANDSNRAGSPRPEAQTERPDAADFDLRKAVVWSEILKPKFDE